MILAVAPGNLFYLHAALRTVYAPHRVDKVHRDLPQRHELEPSLGKTIVARCRLAAARTNRPTVGPRLDRNLDRGLGQGIDPSCFLVNERLVPLDEIEDSFQLHGCGTPNGCCFATPSITGNLAAVYSCAFDPRLVYLLLLGETELGSAGKRPNEG